MKGFFHSAWGVRVSWLAMAALYYALLSMDHNGAHLVAGFLACGSIALGVIGIFFADKVIETMYDTDGVIPSYIEMDGSERALYPVLIACVFLFNEWGVVGVLYGIIKTISTATITLEYLKLLKSKGEIT